MITDYYRPKTLEEALKELACPATYPLGGGTLLSQKLDEDFAVVDLQGLRLNKIKTTASLHTIGSMVTLQMLIENEQITPALKKAITAELPLNLRNMATVGGSIVASDGRSPVLGAFLALDVEIILSIKQKIRLGELLLFRREKLQGHIITAVELKRDLRFSYAQVARSPADKPIVFTVVARWPSSRTRLVLGGWGKLPILAMDAPIDGDKGGVSISAAAKNAAHDASDEWASSDYRKDVASILAMRCFDQVLSGEN